MSEETYSTFAPVCPYCEHEQDHDGGALYDESLTDLECEMCYGIFDVRVYTSTSWTCKPRCIL